MIILFYLFNLTKKQRKNLSLLLILIRLINWISSIIAIYLSFKCNNGFHFGSFLAALCFSPIYLLYRYAVPC